MKIRCPSCSAAYDMDESRVPASGANIKCPKCKNPFRVNKQGVVPPEPPLPELDAGLEDEDGAVPLPAPERPSGPTPVRPPTALMPPPPASSPPPPRPAGESLPPGWAATSHPGERGPATRSPLTPDGLGASSTFGGGDAYVSDLPDMAAGSGDAYAADFPDMAAGDGDAYGAEFPEEVAVEDGDAFAVDFPDGGAAPAAPGVDPFSAAAAFAARSSFGTESDESYELDYGDAPPPTPAAGSFDVSSVRTVSAPEADPALEYASQTAHLGEVSVVGDGPGLAPGLWQVRRKSGKVFGPFDSPTVRQMLQQGQLFGNEDVSADGASWTPLAHVPELAPVGGYHAPRSEPPGLAPQGAPRVPPPVIPVLPVADAEPSAPQEVDETSGKSKKSSRVSRKIALPGWASKLSGKRGVAIAAGAGLLVIGGGGAALYASGMLGGGGGKVTRSAPVAKGAASLLDKWNEATAEGTFRGWQRSLASAQDAMLADPSAVRPKALFAVSAATLRVRYGTANAEVERARSFLDKLPGDDADAALARAAVALADRKKSSEVKSLLAAASKGAMTQRLLAEAHLLSDETRSAAALLDELLEESATPELALLRAQVARQAGDAEAELAAIARALELAPENARARLWRARLHVAAGEAQAATTLLDLALDEGAVRALDASEEALGHRMAGDLAVQARDFERAVQQYQRAMDQEPDDPAHPAALGELLLRRRQFTEAVDVYEKALAKRRSLELLVGSAHALIGAANYVKASERVDAARDEKEHDPRVLVASGALQEALGKLTDAEKLYAEAAERDEAFVPALIADARVKMKLGRTDEAKARAQKALEVAPQDAGAQTTWGRWQLAHGEAATARTAFEKAIAADEALAAAHDGRAEALVRLGDTAEAKAAWERAVALDPQNVALREKLSVLLRQRGEREPALEQLQAALALDPKSARLLGLVGAVQLDLDRLSEAEQTLRQALTLNDAEPVAHDYMGRLLSFKGEHAEAVRHLQQAVDLDPKNADTIYQLGLVHERAQQLIDAADAFRKALSLRDDFLEAREHLGFALAGQSLNAPAIAAFQRVIDQSPDRPTTLAALADCQLKLGRLDDAIRHFKRALELDPSLGAAHYKLGRAYDQKGQLDLAAASYKAATEHDVRSPMPHYYLGYVHKTRGKRQEAIRAFERYLELRTDAPDREEIRDQIYFLSEGR